MRTVPFLLVVFCQVLPGQQDELFTALWEGRRPRYEAALPKHIKRQRLATLKSLQLAFERGVVRVNLFDDVQFSSHLQLLKFMGDGVRVYAGTLDDQPGGEMVLAVSPDAVAGNVTTGEGRRFLVRTVSSDIVAIQEAELNEYPPESSPVEAGINGSSDGAIRRRSAAETVTTIDVLIMYTKTVSEDVGASSRMSSLIAMTVAEANQGFTNSGIPLRLNLVYSGELDYDDREVSDMSALLEAVAFGNDAHLTQVRKLRDTYKADIVSLWVTGADKCGAAYLMTTLSTSFADYAFNVVNHRCATDNFSFAHELGHNLGANHDRESAGQSVGLYPYSYGYRNSRTAPLFRTIEALGCETLSVSCPRLNFWSNPGRTYAGIPMGIDAASSLGADNYRTLSDSRLVAARFKIAGHEEAQPVTSCASWGGADNPLSFTAEAVTRAVPVRAVSDCSWTATTEDGWVHLMGNTGTGTGQVVISVEANGTTADRIAHLSLGGAPLTVIQTGQRSGTPAPDNCVFGNPGDTPIAGDWNGDGVQEVGTYANGVIRLDMNGNCTWDGEGIDKQFISPYQGVPIVLRLPGSIREAPAIFYSGVWKLFR